MDMFVSFCKKLRLDKFFTVFALGFILLLNVACSNGNAVGARPQNPPVQMGGQNNPHKAGGDGYNDYQMSTDPKVKTRDRASLPTSSQLVAANSMGERSFRNDQGTRMVPKPSEAAMRDTMKEAKQIPEQPQAVIDRSDPNEKILEKTGKAFKEASKHLTGETEQSIERTGATKVD